MGEKMTEEEKEEVGMKVMEALEENFETHEEKISQLVYGHAKNDFDDDEEEEDDEDDMEESGVESHHDEAMDTDKPSEVEEDPSNLERAWEMLELAKNIYSKMTSDHSEPSSQAESTRKLCDTLLALGEVSIENENYSQAVKYFNNVNKVLSSMLDSLESDTFSARVGEIDELEGLLPQIQDTMETKEETSQSSQSK